VLWGRRENSGEGKIKNDEKTQEIQTANGYTASMRTETSIPTATYFLQRLKDLDSMRADGPVSGRALRQYAFRAAIFARVYFEQEKALSSGSYINESFAWYLLEQIAPDLYTLESYLFGPLPSELTADLECLLMVLGKPRKGRPPTERTRFLRLADRQQEGESWNRLNLEVCAQTGVRQIKETMRREPRRANKYITSLDSKWEDFFDLAYLEENLFPLHF
jgi:hypothetical protein